MRYDRLPKLLRKKSIRKKGGRAILSFVNINTRSDHFRWTHYADPSFFSPSERNALRKSTFGLGRAQTNPTFLDLPGEPTLIFRPYTSTFTFTVFSRPTFVLPFSLTFSSPFAICCVGIFDGRLATLFSGSRMNNFFRFVPCTYARPFQRYLERRRYRKNVLYFFFSTYVFFPIFRPPNSNRIGRRLVKDLTIGAHEKAKIASEEEGIIESNKHKSVLSFRAIWKV